MTLAQVRGGLDCVATNQIPGQKTPISHTNPYKDFSCNISNKIQEFLCLEDTGFHRQFEFQIYDDALKRNTVK